MHLVYTQLLDRALNLCLVFQQVSQHLRHRNFFLPHTKIPVRKMNNIWISNAARDIRIKHVDNLGIYLLHNPSLRFFKFGSFGF
jgi:hypothetical protein